MKARHLYLAACAIGTILPYSQFVPFLVEHGFDMALFLQLLFANRVSGFFAFDLIVSAAVLCAFVAMEGRRSAVRHRWAPVVATVVVGVSLGLPLFLYLRELSLERAAGTGMNSVRGVLS